MAREPWVLILAGGDGTRLQGLTRAITGAPIPKQYCPLVDGRSLLEDTIARALGLTRPERVVVVLNRAHLPLAAPQLRALPAANVLVQPRNCDTGPGLAFSLAHIARRDPEAVCVVFPSDHWIADQAAFLDYVLQALRIVAGLPTRVALLGIEPDRAEPGFGYIEPGAPVRVGGHVAHRVAAFREKPTREDAERLVERGGLWNSFVMAFQVPAVLRLLARLRPADLQPMQALAAHPDRADALYEHDVRGWNFSSEFLASIPRHLVVLRTAGTGWSDWGTPEAIARTFALLRRMPPWQEGGARTAVA
jgi:mannose-1-phosphate guanylyltransferase